jgi:hypothetical protein
MNLEQQNPLLSKTNQISAINQEQGRELATLELKPLLLLCVISTYECKLRR